MPGSKRLAGKCEVRGATKSNRSGHVFHLIIANRAQSSGPENIGPQRPLPALLVLDPVLSPSCITLKNNGKIRP